MRVPRAASRHRPDLSQRGGTPYAGGTDRIALRPSPKSHRRGFGLDRLPVGSKPGPYGALATAEQSILLADRDHDARSVIAALADDFGLQLESAETGSAVLDAAKRCCPALVLLALDLQTPSSYEVLHQLRVRFGAVLPIVILAARDSRPREEIAALLLGADDYLARPLAVDAMTVRVRRLLTRTPTTQTAEATLTNRVSARALTQREQQVLSLLVEGHRSAEIAELLCITPKTASTHIEHILPKLGAHSQAQAIAFAVRDKRLTHTN